VVSIVGWWQSVALDELFDVDSDKEGAVALQSEKDDEEALIVNTKE
jgi:hypothetical protein